MSSAGLRAVATVFLIGGLVACGLYLFANKPAGTFGFTSSFLVGAPLARVDAIVPHGPAERAGLRVGDVIGAAGTSLRDRAPIFLFANPPLVAQGDSAQIVVRRANGTRRMVLTADMDAGSPRFEAVYFCMLSVPLLLLGWFIIWRKPEDVDAVTLGAMILLFGLWNAGADRLGSPIMRLVFYEVIPSAFVILGVLAGAIFFARYPHGEGTRVSTLRRACVWIAIAATVAELIVMSLTFLLPAFRGATPALTAPLLFVVVVPPLAALICFIDGFRHADIADRVRLRWLGGSFFLGFSGPLLLPAAIWLLGSRFTILDQVLFESTLFILAIGLTYGILRRRVVDLAFAINRALVFSALSGIVVALFICFEWLVGTVFIGLSRQTSFLLQAGAAVIIGFSLRPLHTQVDKFIDRIFFAKRHAAENALRQLATEVNFVRDRPALLERVERDLTDHAEASFVSIYYREDMRSDFLLLRSTEDAPEFINADDDAAVALAVREAPVELHGCHTQLIGELAVPLAVRKALVGILVLGGKVSGETFGPKEIESLCFLAGYLGTALTVKSAGVAEGTAVGSALTAILNELRLQREDLRAIAESLRGR